MVRGELSLPTVRYQFFVEGGSPITYSNRFQLLAQKLKESEMTSQEESPLLALAQKLKVSEMNEQEESPLLVVAQKLEDSEITEQEESPLLVVAQKLEDSEITEQEESPLLTRNLAWIAIFNISYRGLSYFNDKNVRALEIKIKKLMPVDAQSQRLIDWIENGVYDALQKKHLKTLLFCVGETVGRPMIEEYASWMRIGAFLFDSPVAFLTEKLALPRTIPRGVTVEKMVESRGFCVLNNIKTGIWIAGVEALNEFVRESIKRYFTSQSQVQFSRSKRYPTLRVQFIKTKQIKIENGYEKRQQKRSQEEEAMHFIVCDRFDLAENLIVANLVQIAGMEAIGDDPNRGRVFEARQWSEVSQLRSMYIIGADQEEGWVLCVDAREGFVFYNVFTQLKVYLSPYEDDQISKLLVATWVGTPGQPNFELFLLDASSVQHHFIHAHRCIGGIWLHAILQFWAPAPQQIMAGADEEEDDEPYSLHALTCHGGRLHILCGTVYACFGGAAMDLRICQIDLIGQMIGTLPRHFSFVKDGDRLYILMVERDGNYKAILIDYVAEQYQVFPRHDFGRNRVVYSSNYMGAIARDARYPEERGFVFALGGGFGEAGDVECIRLSPVGQPQHLKVCTHPAEDLACYCSSCFLGYNERGDVS